MKRNHHNPAIHRLRLIAMLLLIILLGMTLQACGSDGDDNDDDENGIVVGAAAPDFALTASDGSTVSLADYRGQPVLLFFHMADG